jgi:hypothetical protein
MKQLIAFCGLDCEKCDARIATINNDPTLREKTAKAWSEMNKVEIPAESINCMGCRADSVKFSYCQSMCPIRKCASSKGYETCRDCQEMETCPKVGMVIDNNEEARNNLKK